MTGSLGRSMVLGAALVAAAPSQLRAIDEARARELGLSAPPRSRRPRRRSSNALLAARTMTGADGARVTALPHDRLLQALRTYGRLR